MIADQLAKVVVQFKGDTSDLKKQIRDLTGEEKRLAEEQYKQAEARNKQLESWQTGIKNVGIAFAAFGVTAKFLWDDYKQRAEEARLRTAALNTDMTLLGKAALGTKSQMQLLNDAAKMQGGLFKLTNEQMAIAERAMIGFNRKGHEMAEVQKKVLDAITELKTDGLKDIGLVIDKSNIDLDTSIGRYELLTRTMAGLTKMAASVKDTHRTMAEEVEATTARMADSWRKFKNEWITGMSGSVGGVEVDMMKWLGDEKYRQALAGRVVAHASAIAASGKSVDQYNADWDKAIAANKKVANIFESYETQFPYWMDEMDVRAEMAKRRPGKSKPTMPDYTLGATEYSNAFGGAYGDYDQDFADISSGLSIVHSGLGGQGANYGYLEGADAKFKYQSALSARTASKLEPIFGSLSEFDAYKTAFDTLNGAVGSAFGAWIDGSMSAGAAFKKFISEALKGVAVQMAMEAIKNAAYALGSLAGGDVVGAARYGKAAAAFAAGAVVVGAAAKSLHGGGASATGVGAPGGGVPAYSGGSAGGSASNTVVVFGQDFTQDSSRQRGLRAARALDEAKQHGGGAVSYA